MVADKDLDRTQPLFGLRDGVRAAIRTAEIYYRLVESDLCQLLLAPGNTHDFGAT